jgi:hypothetical protein
MFEKLAEDIAYMTQIKLAALAEQMEKTARSNSGHLARKAKALAKQYFATPNAQDALAGKALGITPVTGAMTSNQEGLLRKAWDATMKLQNHIQRGVDRVGFGGANKGMSQLINLGNQPGVPNQIPLTAKGFFANTPRGSYLENMKRDSVKQLRNFWHYNLGVPGANPL